jgi:hypothetical protein
LKAVAKTGFSLTPPGRAYVIGKTAVDLADDLESGNFEKTANNVIDRVYFLLILFLHLCSFLPHSVISLA